MLSVGSLLLPSLMSHNIRGKVTVGVGGSVCALYRCLPCPYVMLSSLCLVLKSDYHVWTSCFCAFQMTATGCVKRHLYDHFCLCAPQNGFCVFCGCDDAKIYLPCPLLMSFVHFHAYLCAYRCLYRPVDLHHSRLF